MTAQATQTTNTPTTLAGRTAKPTAHDQAGVAPGLGPKSAAEPAVDSKVLASPPSLAQPSEELLFPPRESTEAELSGAKSPKPATATEHAPAPSEASSGKELPDLNDPETIRGMEQEAVQQAEALLALVDQLSGAPLTPENQKAWLRVLEDLTPGPFAQYVVEKMGNAATAPGPVRDQLLEIQTTWHSKYDGKVFYEADLEGLSNVLRPEDKGQQFTTRALEFLRSWYPFS